MTKKAYLSLFTILLLFPLSACDFKAQDSTGKKLKSSHQLEKRCKALKKETDKSPNEVSKEEGIAAEQIIVSISDDGFVTSHGDHYHFTMVRCLMIAFFPQSYYRLRTTSLIKRT